jgi:predicted MFS family arabinose efflux permease
MKMEDSQQYERRLIVLLFFTWGIVFLDRMSQLYLAPYFAPEFHLRPQEIGVLTAVLAISWAVSGFFFGIISDRFGRRVVLVPSILAFSALSCISGLAHNFEQLLFARALMGLAEGPCWPVITALIEETSPPQRRGRNVGIVVSAAALVGLAISPILTTQVAAHFGWRWAFFIAGIPGILISLLIAKFVKEPKSRASETAHGKASLSDYFSLLRHRNIWLCSIGAFGFMTWLFVENAFAPLYITEVAHQTPTTAGWLLGISGLGSFFVGLLLPALSDRVGRKPTLLVVSLLSTMIPIALQMPLLYQHLWLLGMIIFATNGGQCMPALIMVLIPTESVPARFSATAIGLVTLVGEILGATLSPALGGALAGKYGLGLCLWMSAGGTILVFLASLFLKETVGRNSRHGQEHI